MELGFEGHRIWLFRASIRAADFAKLYPSFTMTEDLTEDLAGENSPLNSISDNENQDDDTFRNILTSCETGSARPAKENYEKLEKLGEGSYGVVYKARGKDSGELVAIKKIKCDCAEEGISASTLREISMLNQLRHECVVLLKHAGFHHNHMLLIFEYIEQDLAQYLRAITKYIPAKQVKRLMFQLVSGIEHCHKHRVLHRDLKPANLLIGPNDVLKIADFGLGITHGIPVQHLSDPNEVVTLYYRAPELLLGTKKYTGAIDMWSVGCIFAEVHTANLLFDGDMEWEQLKEIFETLGTPTEEKWPGVTNLPFYHPAFPRWKKKAFSQIIEKKCGGNELCWDFLDKCLTYYPLQRLTAAEALEHPFFDAVRDESRFKWNKRRKISTRPRKRQKIVE